MRICRKPITTCLLLALPFVLITGCVRSHRAAYYTPDYYTYTPAPPPPPAPTSERPESRVYPNMPPGVSAQDLGLADSIRAQLKGDPVLRSSSRNVLVTVDQGVVTLRGSVPSEHQRYEIIDRIKTLPGVARIEDQLAVDVR